MAQHHKVSTAMHQNSLSKKCLPPSKMYFKPWMEVSMKYFLMMSTHLLSSSGSIEFLELKSFWSFFLLNIVAERTGPNQMLATQLESWVIHNHMSFKYVWLNQMAPCECLRHHKSPLIIYQVSLIFTLINLRNKTEANKPDRTTVLRNGFAYCQCKVS